MTESVWHLPVSWKQSNVIVVEALVSMCVNSLKFSRLKPIWRAQKIVSHDRPPLRLVRIRENKNEGYKARLYAM